MHDVIAKRWARLKNQSQSNFTFAPVGQFDNVRNLEVITVVALIFMGSIHVKLNLCTLYNILPFLGRLRRVDLIISIWD